MRILGRLLAQLYHSRSHVLARMDCTALPPLKLRQDEKLVVLDRHSLDEQREICERLLAFNPANQAYLEDIQRDRIVGVVIAVDSRVVHYSFLMKRNRNRCLLGLPADAALIGHAYTVRSYRGKGCQARAVLARAHLARKAGFVWIYAETHPDNLASQRGMVKGGMEILGRLELILLLRCIVIRWRKPSGVSPVSWCC